MDVDYLRAALRDGAELARRPEPDLYDRVLARRRRSVRRRRAALAAGLSTLLVGIAIPVGLTTLVGGGESRPDGVASPPAIPYADIYGVPARGSLAGDAAFVEAIRRLPWTDQATQPGTLPGESSLPDAPLETRSVVFAGDVTGGRWALVVGQNTAQPTGPAADPDLTDLGSLSDIALAWFVGPPGASPDQMALVTVPHGIPADQPTSLYDQFSGALVVVAAPGDRIEISPRPEVEADATVNRTYADTNSTDGTAVLAVDPNPYSAGGLPAVKYRITREGIPVAQQNPDSYGGANPEPPPAIALDYLRPPNYLLPDHLGGNQEQQLAEQIVTLYGLPADQISFQVHYVGPLPGPTAARVQLAVVTAVLPSGAVFTDAFWLQETLLSDGTPTGANGASCAEELAPAGLPPAQRIIAMRCEVATGNQTGPAPESTLVVIAPEGAPDRSLMVEADGGRTTILTGAAGGVSLTPFPEGAKVVTVETGDGTVIEEVPIIGP